MVTQTPISVPANNSRTHVYVRMILSICVGYFGLDRFYDKQVGWGIVKLITLGALGVWWIIDFIYYTYKAGQID